MKFVIICFSILLNIGLAFGQDDSLSLFRKSNTLPTGKDAYKKYQNSIHINILQFVRGGVLFDYERVIANSNIAVGAGIGFNMYDALGQIYFRELEPYYKINSSNVSKIDAKIKPIFDFNVKYYLSDDDFQFYTGAGYTRISNTVITDVLKYAQNFTYSSQNIKELDYLSNEFKFVIGITNVSDRRFYHDFCLGPGYRMIKYENLKYEDLINPSPNSSYSYKLVKETNTNQTIWFFFSWRMGIRF